MKGVRPSSSSSSAFSSMRSLTLRKVLSFFAACATERSMETVCIRRGSWRNHGFVARQLGKRADEMDGEHERRAKNEGLFREVNERIEEVSKLAGIDSGESLLPGLVCQGNQDASTARLEATYQNSKVRRA